jgi:CheY-like chemotaxis protein
MPDGGAISIETANVSLGEPSWPEEPAPGDYVALRVSDTGPGIPDAVRERMFEPFFTTKEIGKGSGLGLSQVLGVVKQLGGGLAVRSAAGEGTCISIFLPRADEVTAEVPIPSHHDAASAPRRRAHVLLVDDDPDVRSTTAAMLSDAGYVVVEAPTGAAALDVLQRAEDHTDLVVADIGMPGINGLELAALVQRTWPALPVLLITGYADSHLLRKGTEHEVLRKPFQVAELDSKVRQAIVRGRDRPG